ncbi:hypothetical protein BB560_006869 [Smittium megazygosporum]|uniref:MYND-type domain-containing protein n=1 Tax=Smittium megazygosporum TaxID=133381 RepID=A0A2T9Y0N5_9FUNG|nr:hypothetical protein BB560_006869 [Smittium megazygosporum]
MKVSTIALLTTLGIVGVGVGYLAYFDYNRRNNPQFRKELKKSKKRAAKIAKKAASKADETLGERAAILVSKLKDVKLPNSPEEKEQYFMTQITAGETYIKDDPMSEKAAIAFYSALKVYPNPVQLIMIYEKSVPKEMFALIISMMDAEVKIRKAKYYELFPPKSMNVKFLPYKPTDSKADAKSAESHPGIVTTKSFKAGQTIFSEKPFIANLLPECANGKYCNNCMKPLVSSHTHDKASTPSKASDEDHLSISQIPEISASIDSLADSKDSISNDESSKLAQEESQASTNTDDSLIHVENVQDSEQQEAVKSISLSELEASSDGIAFSIVDAVESTDMSEKLEPVGKSDSGSEINPSTEDTTEPEEPKSTTEPEESKSTTEPEESKSTTEPEESKSTTEPEESKPAAESEKSKPAIESEESKPTTETEEPKSAAEDKLEAKEGAPVSEETTEKQVSAKPEKTPVIECTTCHKAFYCSESCKSEDYSFGHQFICSSTENAEITTLLESCKDTKSIIPIMLIYLLGTVFDIENKKQLSLLLGIPDISPKTAYLNDSKDSEDYSSWEHIERLNEYPETVPEVDPKAAQSLTSILNKKMQGFAEILTADKISSLKSKLFYNSYSIQLPTSENAESTTSEAHSITDKSRFVKSDSLEAIGLGLYFMSSFIKSGPESNVTLKFLDSDNTISLVATKDLEVGDELFADYTF